MFSDLAWPMFTVLALGAFHGANPAMGWLFAVALGLQEKRRRAVWSALVPLALGHTVAIGCVVLLMMFIGRLIPPGALKIGTALVLVGFCIFLFIRHRHPRYGGMRVGFRDLTIWSFLVATAHGAGLMVIPFLFGPSGGPLVDSSLPTDPVPVVAGMHDHTASADASVPGINRDHAEHMSRAAEGLPVRPLTGILMTIVHSTGYLLIMGIVAVVVYERFGLRLLRTHWINLDFIWMAALVLTAAFTLLL